MSLVFFDSRANVEACSGVSCPICHEDEATSLVSLQSGEWNQGDTRCKANGEIPLQALTAFLPTAEMAAMLDLCIQRGDEATA